MNTKTTLTVLALLMAQNVSAVSIDANLNTAPITATGAAGLQVNANATIGGSATSDTDMNADINTNINSQTSASASTSQGDDVMTMQSSANTVTSVDTSSDNKVTVKYKRPAKLFGFIPMSVTERATVTVEDDGTRTADVGRSWWAFMAKVETKTDQFLAQLKSRLQTKANAGASVSGSTTLTESEKTEFVSEINAAADAAYR
jgi:hypothetical protein